MLGRRGRSTASRSATRNRRLFSNVVRSATLGRQRIDVLETRLSAGALTGAGRPVPNTPVPLLQAFRAQTRVFASTRRVPVRGTFQDEYSRRGETPSTLLQALTRPSTGRPLCEKQRRSGRRKVWRYTYSICVLPRTRRQANGALAAASE